MTNEEKAKKYDNRKYMVASLGTGAMVGNAAFGIWDSVANNLDCGTAVIAVGTISLLVTALALAKTNPYKEIVQEEKEQVKEDKLKVKKIERK